MCFIYFSGGSMIVVIPAYQPDERLLSLVSELRALTDYSIIIVNDGSDVSKAPIFEALGEHALVLAHDVNRGKGRALKTAYEYIRDSNVADEGIVTVDADGQHLVRDVIRICEEWKKDRAALVLGKRCFTGSVPWRSRAGNAVTRCVFAVSTGVKVYDTQTGLRAFSSEYIDKMLEIKGERYEYEINQLLIFTREHIRITEIPIETVYLDGNRASHFNTVKDSWRIYRTIFSFLASSFVSGIVDYTLLLTLNSIFLKAGTGAFSLFGFKIDTELTALILARIVSSLCNYILNRKVVFHSKSNVSLLRYYITVAGLLAFNYGLLRLFQLILPLWIAQLLSQALIYPVNFILQRKFVFPVK